MKPPVDELPLDAGLTFLQGVWELNHALERLSSRMERRLGVTAQQRFIVRCVGKYPGMTPGQLARILHLDPGTVSAALRRLERQELIERRRDPRDGRRVTLGLTPRGRMLDGMRGGTAEAAVVRVLESSKPSETQTTQAMLRRLATAFAEVTIREKP
ncbi:MAG: MarR family transcriptional regulator [Candidatus Eisenbacteria bacterium]